jgi:trk system potassium uptake protein TrkH
VDTRSHWSPFGEAVILALIQVGGLGYMFGATIVLWALGRRLGLRDRNMLRLYYGAPSMSEAVSFARAVALFTFAFELAGAALLTVLFTADGVPVGRAAWWGVFHSVSAFNNAGFNVTGADMIPFADNPLVLLTLTALIVAGGIGFLPASAIARRRSILRLPLDHQLIFATSAALLLAGTLFLLLVEWDNQETFGRLAPGNRAAGALFHSASSRTAGFASIDPGDLHDESKMAIVGLMFVGGAAGSTAGGMKVGTLALLLAVMRSAVIGSEDVHVFRRRAPELLVRQTAALALSFGALVFGLTMMLALVSSQPFLDTLFETVSALCTVGFTAAGTPNFGAAGHYVLIVAMLTGRFGPLLLVLYMTRPHHRVRYRYPEDSVRIG